MIQKKERYRTYFMLLFDLAAALVSFRRDTAWDEAYQHLTLFSPSVVNPALYSLQHYFWFYLISSSIILLFLLCNSGFKPVYRFRDLPGQAVLLLEQLVLIAFSLGFFSFLFKLEASRSLMLMYLGVLFGLMMTTRIITVVYYRSVGMKNGERRVIVIGNSPRIYEIGENISQYADLGFSVVGYVTDSEDPHPPADDRVNPGRIILGPTGSVQQILEDCIVDEVVFASSGNDDLKLFEKIAMLCDVGIDPLSLDFFPHSISRTSLDFIENQPFLTFSPCRNRLLRSSSGGSWTSSAPLVGTVLSIRCVVCRSD
jgi:FlaA1/EpsC-like NDP-sugar epimerase